MGRRNVGLWTLKKEIVAYKPKGRSIVPMTATLVLDCSAEETEDSAKRRQIVEGARTVFRALGFDAASMGEIAKAAGVSKGTLYVYFKDKDELFQAIVEKECSLQAEGVLVFDLEGGDPDIAGTLTRLGVAFMKALCEPERLSTTRTVMAIADRKPSIGRTFCETGPAKGLAKLGAYLEAQVAAGRLVIEDPEVAAAQFIEACHATMLKPMMLNFAPPPSLERVEHVVGIAVKTFMAAYGRK
jgi:AcrR family transcriptional regulator